MKNTKAATPEKAEMHVIAAPYYMTKPMPLVTQWTLCDENGYLEGNVLFEMNELVAEDEETLLDLMSTRLVGDQLLSDISYKAIGMTADNSIIVSVRGCIVECDPTSSDLEEICEKIKTAILNGGEDVARDFIEEPVYGRPEEDIKERVDEVLDGMPIIELLKYFKKYMTPNVGSNPSKPPFERFLTSERIGTPRVDIDLVNPDRMKKTIQNHASAWANSMNQNNTKLHFQVAGLQFCPDDYMTAAGLKRLMNLLDSNEFEIIQIDGNGNTTSYFLISAKLYAKLDVEDINELKAFIAEILDNVDKETPDGQYDWHGHRIFLNNLTI